MGGSADRQSARTAAVTGRGPTFNRKPPALLHPTVPGTQVRKVNLYLARSNTQYINKRLQQTY